MTPLQVQERVTAYMEHLTDRDVPSILPMDFWLTGVTRVPSELHRMRWSLSSPSISRKAVRMLSGISRDVMEIYARLNHIGVPWQEAHRITVDYTLLIYAKGEGPFLNGSSKWFRAIQAEALSHDDAVTVDEWEDLPRWLDISLSVLDSRLERWGFRWSDGKDSAAVRVAESGNTEEVAADA